MRIKPLVLYSGSRIDFINMTMILFRADANPAIGTGHVMRCLSIAQALRERGAECVFVSSNESTQTLVDANAFPCHILSSNTEHLDEELPAFTSLLQQMRPDWIVVDSYFVSDSYLSTIHAFAPIAYLDDFATHAYPVSLIINYNIFATENQYITLYPASVNRLLGVVYAPLRREFCNRPLLPRDTCENLLLSTGGADPMHAGLQMLRAIAQDPRMGGLVTNCIVGAFHPDAETIMQFASKHPSIRVHRSVSQMADLMCASDVAVSAAGSTLYELSACGIPSVCYTFVDNQLQVAQGFSDAGLIQYAGDFRGDASAAIEAILERVSALRGDLELRRTLSKRMRQTVDANGAWRIADALLGFLAPS